MTRCSPTRAGSRTRIYGSAPAASGSTYPASTPIAASEAVLARVRRDFESGVRAGVVTTPTLFAGGEMLAGLVEPERLDELAGGSSTGS